jgi:hypothetical protein
MPAAERYSSAKILPNDDRLGLFGELAMLQLRRLAARLLQTERGVSHASWIVLAFGDHHYLPALERRRRNCMLWIIAVVLALLWLLGVVTAYTLSGFIHLLLFLAIALVLIRVIQGRRPIS